jgi:hypothetical protein
MARWLIGPSFPGAGASLDHQGDNRVVELLEIFHLQQDYLRGVVSVRPLPAFGLHMQ